MAFWLLRLPPFRHDHHVPGAVALPAGPTGLGAAKRRSLGKLMQDDDAAVRGLAGALVVGRDVLVEDRVDAAV